MLSNTNPGSFERGVSNQHTDLEGIVLFGAARLPDPGIKWVLFIVVVLLRRLGRGGLCSTGEGQVRTP